MCGKGAPSRAIIDGLLAQRRLDGDKTIIAMDVLGFQRSLWPRAKGKEERRRQEGYIAH